MPLILIDTDDAEWRERAMKAIQHEVWYHFDHLADEGLQADAAKAIEKAIPATGTLLDDAAVERSAWGMARHDADAVNASAEAMMRANGDDYRAEARAALRAAAKKEN